MLYICIKFCQRISKGFRVTDFDSRVDAKMVAIYKGHNSIKFVDGVTVFSLFILSDDALYLYQIPRKNLKGICCY